MHSASIVEISDHLLSKIEFVESREKVNELLGKLEELAGTGMIELQETTVAKPAQCRSQKAGPSCTPQDRSKAKMMRIYIGEADRWKEKPLYNALVEAMRANDMPASLSIAASSAMEHIGGFTRTRPCTCPMTAQSCSQLLTRKRSCDPFFRSWNRW